MAAAGRIPSDTASADGFSALDSGPDPSTAASLALEGQESAGVDRVAAVATADRPVHGAATQVDE